MSDRKDAREFAATGINKWENEEMNLRAAFLEAEAELEQERDIRSDRESTITAVAEALNVLMEPHQTFFERLPERAAELQRRLEEVEAATIKHCAQLAYDTTSDDPQPGDWNEACRHIHSLLYALSTQPNAASKSK